MTLPLMARVTVAVQQREALPLRQACEPARAPRQGLLAGLAHPPQPAGGPDLDNDMTSIMIMRDLEHDALAGRALGVRVLPDQRDRSAGDAADRECGGGQIDLCGS